MKIRILSINPEPVQKGSIIEYVKVSSGKKISKLDLILERLDNIDRRLTILENKVDTIIRLNNLRTE